MNILLVLYHDFSTASAIHVHNFANLLVKRGHRCAVAVPENKDSIYTHMTDKVLYHPCTFAETLAGALSIFMGNAPDIVHAWTPRENVRKQCDRLQKKYPECRLVVHLEDNEELIVESFTRIPYDALKSLPEKRLEYILPDLLASPYHYPFFLQRADAVTIITDDLLEFVPEKKKYLRLWPAIDLNRFSPSRSGLAIRKRLGIADKDLVLCYVGSVHGVNSVEVRSLYLAVYLANRLGIPARLIRAGRDVVDFLGDCSAELQQYVVNLGYVAMDEVPALMAAADLLVQPGKNDRFNRYRLPSKIPEFLAVGRPVAVPRANIGLHLEDGSEALIMPTGDAAAIVEIIRKVYNDRQCAARIGLNGRKFAERHFAGEKISEQLTQFYSQVLTTQN